MKYLKSRLFYEWILATIGGALFANTLHIAYLAMQPVGGAEALRVGSLLLTAVLAGTLTGFCQWIVLRPYLKKAYGWIVATATGKLLTILLTQTLLSILAFVVSPDDRVSFGLMRFVSALSLSLTVSLLQWLFLRRQVSNAWQWIGFSLLADLIVPRLLAFEGLVVPLAETSLLQSFLVVVAWGLLMGAITGIPIVNFIETGKDERLSTGNQ
ncbi:MAG: hypothetical protein ACFB16_09875 [Phormidesmis sp.]